MSLNELTDLSAKGWGIAAASLELTNPTNQLVFLPGGEASAPLVTGPGITVTAPAPAANRLYTIPDAGGPATFALVPAGGGGGGTVINSGSWSPAISGGVFTPNAATLFASYQQIGDVVSCAFAQQSSNSPNTSGGAYTISAASLPVAPVLAGRVTHYLGGHASWSAVNVNGNTASYQQDGATGNISLAIATITTGTPAGIVTLNGVFQYRISQ